MRILSLFAAIVAALVVGGSLAARAQDSEIRLRLAVVTSQNSAFYAGATTLADEVRLRSNGTVSIEVFPGGALGGERDVLEGMQLGSVDMFFGGEGLVGLFVPSFEIFALPFLFADSEGFYAATRGEAGRALLDDVESAGFKGLGFGLNGFRDIMNNVRPINTVQNLEGMRIRLREVPVQLQTFELLGASPVPIPLPELYTALQTGVVSGVENNVGIIYGEGHHEQLQYLSFTRHFVNVSVLLISDSSWRKLSDAQREALEASVEAAMAAHDEFAVGLERRAMEAIEREGRIQVNTVADIQPFVDATADLRSDFLEGRPEWLAEVLHGIEAIREE